MFEQQESIKPRVHVSQWVLIVAGCFPFSLGCKNKGLFRFRMRNEILRRSEKIETRSKKHDFSYRNSPAHVIQWGLLAVYRTPVHVQCCFIITQELLLEASKTNTSFARLSASSMSRSGSWLTLAVSHSVWVVKPLFRVATVALTWKTWKSHHDREFERDSESQGICNRIPEVRKKSRNSVVWNSFSAKLKILILKLFWGNMSPYPPKWSQTHGRA